MTTNADSSANLLAETSTKRGYNLFLLLVAGLGGLLYGIDVGIIGGALPYLEATSHLTAAELSVIVAAVLAGQRSFHIVCGTTGRLDGPQAADDSQRAGLRRQHSGHRSFAGIWAACSSVACCRASAAGFIGVVVPLYLAECLSASSRGKGTGIFQWLLTLGIVVAALVGIYYSYRVEAVAQSARCRRALRISRIRRGGASSGSRCRRECCLCSAVCS